MGPDMADQSQSSSMVSSAPRVETVWTLLPTDDNSPPEHVTWNFDTPQGVAFELEERLVDGHAPSQTTCTFEPPQNSSTAQLYDESITIVQQVTITSKWATEFVKENPEIVSMLDEIYVVLDNINTERVVCGLPKLVLSPKLCKRAYDFADVSKAVLAPMPHKRYMWFVDQRRKYQGNATSIEETAVIDTNETTKFTRLVSTAGLGGLACAGKWISGRHKRHLTDVDPRKHHEDCACKEWIVYQALMNPAHELLGLVRDPHHRWIAVLIDEGGANGTKSAEIVKE